ncbi:PTS transporter subunit EIIC [Isobaculum melis]|uniref:PTS system beta-glucoside-specific IIA component, Glc family /PTS system beta-glucoside-specific IIB component, Glc family /PTS system beta-glucoside-specific IIC component, Glc family n=1 Tax=Isobaculum melis TaxID=142588 RepID=A0A1H9TG54_9LACT|nr:PTS transporter subunit EIIC [Isobaculum melis]SER95799.1 PTS system beta-glucoside-specific IIA component, Glc family /PTS system beta-glucoside-specific IIB component, Glc family /PTS system beta-glucoside-specific IIC component, Glc family [Isobaculum melis]
MKYEDLAKTIIEKVGGKGNVISVVHCMTRLRFKLKDESLAKTDELKDMDGIVTVMQSGGQYQVVIGNHVSDVYKAVTYVGGFNNEEALEIDEGDNKHMSLFDKFIDTVSGVFTPTLGVLAGTGMIKGLLAILTITKLVSADSGTYLLLNAIGDSLFYFFPIILGYSASKKFKGNPFIGMVIGACLVYPAVVGMAPTLEGPGEGVLYTLFKGTVIESPIKLTFFGLPVILPINGYGSSVIPVIFAAFFGAKVEKFFKKVIPDVVKMFLVPFFTILIVVPLTFLIIGPIASWLGDLLGAGSLAIYDLSPIVAGALIGGLWQVFVMFGLHWGLVPIALINLGKFQSDPVLALTFAASFAQIGAVLAVVLKSKNDKVKGLGISAFITGIFGITEPAIYGITLPRKKPFIMSCIGAGVGGALIGLFGGRSFQMGGLGIFAIPNKINPVDGIGMDFYGTLIAIAAGFVVGFFLTYMFSGKEEATLK